MIIHKEYALRRFCEVPLKHEGCRDLLEKICAQPTQLQRLVFVTTRAYLPNTMVISQQGSGGVPFELSLGSEEEQLILVNGGLQRKTQKTQEVCLTDPALAWEALQSYWGLIHVQLVFSGDTPDWYRDIAVPNEAVPPELAPGFASFVREQIDLLLWAITLKARLDEALDRRDAELFYDTVPLYKHVLQSCFWEL
ncbi:MAG TPA: YpiB family protein [Limnochordia bacterium]|nr:YpiB family protein [Limnochordia bacterium]